jgi:hypothetical protein
MRAYRDAPTLGVCLCVVAAAMAGCAEAQKDQPGEAGATFTYSCCSDADVAQLVHPGDVLYVHWLVSSGPPSRSAGPVPVTLSASLTGSFADAAQLKGSFSEGVPSPMATASPVQTTSQAGGTPVSAIAVPPDAVPGLYDLTTSVESGGVRLSGGSIVRIEPRATS